jgi:hypothetical protein
MVQLVNDSVLGVTVAVVPFGTVTETVTLTGEALDALHFWLLPGSPVSCKAFSVNDTVAVLPTVVVSLPPTVTLFVTVSAQATPWVIATTEAVSATRASVRRRARTNEGAQRSTILIGWFPPLTEITVGNSWPFSPDAALRDFMNGI